MKGGNFILQLNFLIFLSCNPDKTKSSISQEDSIRLAIEDSIVRAKLDSIKKAEDEIQAYLNRPWNLGTFTDEYGEPTKEKFIKTSVVGNFSNSATSNEYLYVKVLVDKNSAGIFLHEYNDSNPPQKFIGTARIKMKNSLGKELEIFSGSSWNQNGGILISNFTEVKGAESYDFSNFKNFIKKSNGEIKFVIYDKYSSTYRFTIDPKGFSEEYGQL